MARPTKRTSDRPSAFRTPLAVLGGFAVIAEGLVGGAAAASPYLNDGQRWFLVISMVLLLFASLAVLYRLIANHHEKLYAPFEFQSDEGFIRAMSAREQKEKIEAELDDDKVTAPSSDSRQPDAEVSETTSGKNSLDATASPGSETAFERYSRIEGDLASIMRRLLDFPVLTHVKIHSPEFPQRPGMGIDALVEGPRGTRLFEFKVLSGRSVETSVVNAGIAYLALALPIASCLPKLPVFGTLIAITPDEQAKQAVSNVANRMLESLGRDDLSYVAISEGDLRRLLGLPESSLRADPLAQSLSAVMLESIR